MLQCSNAVLQLYRLNHKSPTKPNREPVDKLSDGDKADSKAKSTDPSKAGDEVQPGHLGSSRTLDEKQKFRILTLCVLNTKCCQK